MATKKELPVASDAAELQQEIRETKKEKADNTAFCVYLGPSIHGVIQSGMLLPGNRAAAEAALTDAITRYPLIKQLIVTDKTLAEDRMKVKTAGNLLYVNYQKLCSGKSK